MAVGGGGIQVTPTPLLGVLAPPWSICCLRMLRVVHRRHSAPSLPCLCVPIGLLRHIHGSARGAKRSLASLGRRFSLRRTCLVPLPSGLVLVLGRSRGWLSGTHAKGLHSRTGIRTESPPAPTGSQSQPPEGPFFCLLSERLYVASRSSPLASQSPPFQPGALPFPSWPFPPLCMPISPSATFLSSGVDKCSLLWFTSRVLPLVGASKTP